MLATPRSHYFISSYTILQFLIRSILPQNPPQESEKKLFKNELSNILKTPHVFLTSSCRMSIYYLLMTLKPTTPFDVIVTSITIPDIINSIIVAGGRPCFVDLDLKTHGICHDDLLRKISPSTKFIILTDLSGIVHDISKTRALINRNDIMIINDISQSYDFFPENIINQKERADFLVGSLSCGKYISSLTGGFIGVGDCNVRDLLAKTLSTYQKGELPLRTLFYYAKEYLVTNLYTHPIFFTLFVFPYLFILNNLLHKDVSKIQLEREIDNYKKKGKDIFFDIIPPSRTTFPQGFHTNISEPQAWLARESIHVLKNKQPVRIKKLKYFLSLLSPQVLAYIPPKKSLLSNYNVYHFPVLCPEGQRDSLSRELLCLGIDTCGYGLNLCHEEKLFADYWSACPNATIIKNRIIFIPLSEWVTDSVLKRAANKLNDYFSQEF